MRSGREVCSILARHGFAEVRRHGRFTEECDIWGECCAFKWAGSVTAPSTL